MKEERGASQLMLWKKKGKLGRVLSADGREARADGKEGDSREANVGRRELREREGGREREKQDSVSKRFHQTCTATDRC